VQIVDRRLFEAKRHSLVQHEIAPPLAQHARLSSSAKADDPVNTKLSDYWMPTFAGMTAEIRAIPQKGIDIPALALSSVRRHEEVYE